ncbi:ABC transporter permease [Microbacterium sp. dk485]|uniref:ABC transporter permease n=1 Tax=Microbacterium TaxID=33882 RepID=UPI0010749EB6|nr:MULTISPECIES: ABC transporter permease [Microbacterium]TFV84119.1 ABC transporter permease [Microbacterium sp. dk485]TXK16069.1 ABC transporter permease [Microbacterium wangchenii]
MKTVLLKRGASGIALVLVISFLAQLLVLPGLDNIARNVLGELATDAQVAQKAHELGLDRPLLVRYADWLGSAVQGDLGSSFYTTQSVTDAIASRLPVTMSLVVLVTAMTALIAFALGIASAVSRGAVDRSVQLLVTVGDALPAFVIGMFFATLFAVQLHWFPATGYVPFEQSPPGWIAALVLPVAAMTISGVVGVSQHVRSSAITVLKSDYLRTRRSRGLSSRYLLLTTVLRNAATPGLAALAVQIVGLLGASVVIEMVFALPGMGSLVVQAALRSDIPIILGVLMTFVLIVVVVNLLVDLLIAWVNPKVRFGA